MDKPHLIKTAHADTTNIVPSTQDASDDTGDIIADITADDCTANPDTTSAKNKGDGMYTTKQMKTLYFSAFDTSGITAGSEVTAAVLHLQYGAQDGYNGNNYLQYDNGSGLINTSIQFTDITGWSSDLTYDLYAQGVDTVSELGALDMYFYSNDTPPPDCIHIDYMWITVTYNTPTIDVGTSGTQVARIDIPTTGAYVGGAWTLQRRTGSANVTQIVINEEGTVDANADLSNLRLYYETAGTCTYNGTETAFNSSGVTFNASDQATATGTIAVGTSQICLYAVLNVGSGATAYETLDLEITDPSNDVTASAGDVAPATAQAISGTTTLRDPGTLSVDIVDSGGTSVASPSVALGGVTFSWSFQTSNGTLGTASEKIRVQNSTINEQWTLAIAANGGSTTLWDGPQQDYDFNDPTASAGDGADADSFGGQLTVNASGGTITPEAGCTSTGLTLGGSAGFSEGVTDSVTILSAGATASSDCYWDLTGVSLSQSIPAEQYADSYDIDMTLTVTAV